VPARFPWLPGRIEDYIMPGSNPLRRSRRNRWIGGVCGGLAEWLGWSPALVRFLYVVISIVSVGFPGTLAYLVLWIIMPLEPRETLSARIV
jgi:phage shock protein PspC (stress-responsive transcriptional regulator)